MELLRSNPIIGFFIAILLIQNFVSTSQTSNCQLYCSTSISTNDFDNIYSTPGATPTSPRISNNVVFDWEACDCKYWYAKIDNNNAIKIPHPFYDGVRTNAVINIFASKDYLKTNGWELLLHDFGQVSPTREIYFILYNKYTGVLRTYWYSYSASSQPTSTQKYVFTLSFSNLYKATGTLAMANAEMNASEAYLQNSIDGYKDVMVYEAPALAKNQWTVGEFQLGADSYIKNIGYNNSIMQLQISAVSTSSVKLSINGTTNTIDSDEYFKQNNTTADGIAYKASATRGANGSIQKLEAIGAKATEYITKAEDFRKKIADGSKSLVTSLTGTKSFFLVDNVMTPASQIYALAKEGGTFDKIFGVASKVLSGFTGGVEVLKFVGNTLGFLSPGDNSTTPTPVRPTITTYNLSVNGTIETPSYVLNIPLKVPGVSTDIAASNLLTYYDCPTGIISLDNTPILQRINYNRLVESFESNQLNRFGYLPYSSYKLSNDLKFTINESSDLELVDLKTALIGVGSINLKESFTQNYGPGNFTINTETMGIINVIATRTGPVIVGKYTYFNPIVNEIGSKILEMYKYDINQQSHTVGTPLINYNRMKGLTITLPSNMQLNIQVMAVFRRKSKPNDAPVVFTKSYIPNIVNSNTPDNFSYENSTNVTELPPFSNYTNKFTTPSYKIDFADQSIPKLPSSEFVVREGYKITVPPQSGVFAEASSILTISNVKTNKSNCLVLENGLPSTNCSPTSDPIIFQANNVVLKNNVVFSKESRVIVRNPNMGYKLPNASSGSVINTLASTASCYNQNAVLKRVGDLSEITPTSLFPNPVLNGALYFSKKVSWYELRTLTGLMLLQGINTEKIDVSNLPTGIYLLDFDNKQEKIMIP